MESPNLGRTEQFAKVRLNSDQPIGSIVAAKLTDTVNNLLVAQKM